MIIFVPVDDGTACCAFLDTVTDRFVENLDGEHTFSSDDEIWESFDREFADRLSFLVPRGYFERPSTHYEEK